MGGLPATCDCLLVPAVIVIRSPEPERGPLPKFRLSSREPGAGLKLGPHFPLVASIHAFPLVISASGLYLRCAHTRCYRRAINPSEPGSLELILSALNILLEVSF